MQGQLDSIDIQQLRSGHLFRHLTKLVRFLYTEYSYWLRGKDKYFWTRLRKANATFYIYQKYSILNYVLFLYIDPQCHCYRYLHAIWWAWGHICHYIVNGYAQTCPIFSPSSCHIQTVNALYFPAYWPLGSLLSPHPPIASEEL